MESAWKLFRHFELRKKTMKSINSVFDLTWSKGIGDVSLSKELSWKSRRP